jgi:hypothetical protein
MQKKQLQSECNVYLESLHLEFDASDGLTNTYKNIETSDASLRSKNNSQETTNNKYRHGYYESNADVRSYANHRVGMVLPKIDYSNWPGETEPRYKLPITTSKAPCAYSDSLVRKPAVRKKKNRTTKAEKQFIAGQEDRDAVHYGSDNSALLLPPPLDDTLTTTYAVEGLNLAMDNPSLSSYSAHQATGFFLSENRHKKLSRATENERADLDSIDTIPSTLSMA